MANNENDVEFVEDMVSAPPDEMNNFVIDALINIPFFTIIITIILYIIFDTSFWNGMLKKINPGAVNLDCKNINGVVITGVILGILIAIFEALHSARVI